MTRFVEQAIAKDPDFAPAQAGLALTYGPRLTYGDIPPAPAQAEMKSAALKAAWEKLGLPTGADFFLSFRQFIASHEDTFVDGPTTAADFLASRKKK